MEWLPAYAPELRAVEMLWNDTKYADPSHFIAEDAHNLHQAITLQQPIRAPRRTLSGRSSKMQLWNRDCSISLTKTNDDGSVAPNAKAH